MKNILKKLSKKSLVILICCFIVVILIITTILFVNKNSRKKLEIITKSNLEKIINVSDLSTLEAVYNGIAKVTNNEEPDEVNYYVSYDAKIKAGIDFQQVDINLDNEKKVIKVKIPEINVDIASLDYIFMNDKANTKTVSEQAYEKCIEDVTSEVDTEDAIYELAKENAQNIIEALIKPFINQLDAEYKLEIN